MKSPDLGRPPHRQHKEYEDRYSSRSRKRESPYDSDRPRDRSPDRKKRRRSDSPDDSRRRRPREHGSDRRRDRDREGLRKRSPYLRDERRRRDGRRDHDTKSRETDSVRRSPDAKSSTRRWRDENDEPAKESRRGKELVNKDKASLRQRGPLPPQEVSFAVEKGEEPEKPVEKPNFSSTGRLAADSNSVKKSDGTTVALKYHEPAEARKPSSRDQYKLFVFKGADIVDEVPLNARTCWLIGRDKAIADYPAEHPSISKQHAVIQFRYVEKRNEFGDKIGKVKPYLLDLESANGTALNGEEIADSRYYEIKDKDMLQFGDSTREYVLMAARG
ncbi:hypothetical protein MKZ38_001361 [Zalerion maritima]|uniref:FHA domain-containing protein n=1 Tax=Zalerion maritima TaxID=339359 RepID=A0AAD5RQG2_9PEZI|nr:hypothetical protein MKZ38_001361 [Zalerion maritima]